MFIILQTKDDSNTDGETPLTLSNITLTVQPGEKVASCGRTGSGKSSLLALLLERSLKNTPYSQSLTGYDDGI